MAARLIALERCLGELGVILDSGIYLTARERDLACTMHKRVKARLDAEDSAALAVEANEFVKTIEDEGRRVLHAALDEVL